MRDTEKPSEQPSGPHVRESRGRPRASGGPAISAKSRHGELVPAGTVLGWCDGVWAGDPDAKQLAELAVHPKFGCYPLPLVPGGIPVHKGENELAYAVAVIKRILGPVDWACPPPPDQLPEYLYDDDLINYVVEGTVVA